MKWRIALQMFGWRAALRRTAMFGCAALLSTLPSIAWPQHDHPTGQSAAPVVGSPAVPFDLRSLDGKSVGLATFRGKPLVMNFFASWCDPCREEMPLINELASKGMKDGYSVLGIAVEDTRAAVAEYAREAKLSFPIALDLNSTVKRSYRIFGPPATFFVDGQGIIRDVVLGPVTADRAREGLRKSGVAIPGGSL
jgi:cytochrome c biogenesis protein CcmG/thiol:disulfide interchange protein DsbE